MLILSTFHGPANLPSNGYPELFPVATNATRITTAFGGLCKEKVFASTRKVYPSREGSVDVDGYLGGGKSAFLVEWCRPQLWGGGGAVMVVPMMMAVPVPTKSHNKTASLS